MDKFESAQGARKKTCAVYFSIQYSPPEFYWTPLRVRILSEVATLASCHADFVKSTTRIRRTSRTSKKHEKRE